MANLLIAGLICGYGIWVIWVKYKDFRKGTWCSGCCRDCDCCKKDK